MKVLLRKRNEDEWRELAKENLLEKNEHDEKWSDAILKDVPRVCFYPTICNEVANLAINTIIFPSVKPVSNYKKDKGIVKIIHELSRYTRWLLFGIYSDVDCLTGR